MHICQSSKIRLEMVEKGIYDFAITSKLAYLKNNNDKLSMAMEFRRKTRMYQTMLY